MNIFKIIVFSSLIVLSCNCNYKKKDSQIGNVVFKGIDFDSTSNYTFIVQDSENHCYISSNKKLLTKLQQEWQTDSLYYFNRCGYHYYSYLLTDDEIISTLWLNKDCNTLTIDGKFDCKSANTDLFISMLKKFDNIYRYDKQIKNIKELRTFLSQFDKNDIVFRRFYKDNTFLRVKDLLKYQLLIKFIYTTEVNQKSNAIEKLINKMNIKYQYHDYKLFFNILNYDNEKETINFIVYILCEENFFRDFDLYENVLNDTTDFELSVYSKKKANCTDYISPFKYWNLIK